MTGFFELKTAAGLREKLRREFDKLKSNPRDHDVAFNFFVTAEHIPEWMFPDPDRAKKATALRKSLPLLEICSHLATGAKHFEPNPKRHDSVTSTETRRRGGYRTAYATAYGGFSIQLIVQLDGDAAIAFGETIGLMDLAQKVMDYWDAQPLT